MNNELTSMTATPSLEMISILAGAIGLSAGGTWLVLHKFKTIGIDHPDQGRKQHETPTPRLGGLPIYITLMAGFSIMALLKPHFLIDWWPVILTNTLIFAIGFLDDLKPLGARVKLLGQIGTACILYALGISIEDLTNPFRGGAHFDLGAWSFPITILWLIAIPNIINLIDGMDGLATGFGVFLCMTLAFIGHFNGRGDIVLMSVVMSGALAGFLVFNYPPARIFLGDGGAYLIGFYIASSSLLASQKSSVLAAVLVIVVALGVPILDTFLAILRRAIRGVPIFRADAEHIHHRLVLIGFSKARALIAMYSVSVVLSLLGISILLRRGTTLPIVGAVLFLLSVVAVRYLGYVKSWRQLREQINLALERRRHMLFSGAYGRVTEWEAERCTSVDEFVRETIHAIERVNLHPASETGMMPVPVSLINGAICRLYYVPDPLVSPDHWSAKASMFAPALNCAVERWRLLPGLEIVQPPDKKPS